MDDFGTGYSSLSHIQNFPVDIIKIDKSFIQQLDETGKERQRALAMVRATAAMAKDLGIMTVAEGVETESSLALTCRMQHRSFARLLLFQAAAF